MVGRHQDTAKKQGTSAIVEFCKHRRPFMHIVVMFANDEPVLHYAQEVAYMFQEYGVDIFFNTDALEVLSPASKNVAGDGGPQFIRPEHLSPIILSSHADYLMVIGDKNMRNRSCQARDAGRLTEMPIKSRLSSLMAEFYCGSIMPRKSKPPEDLASFNTVQLSEILSALTGVRRVPERVEQVKQILADLEDSDAPKLAASLGESFEEHAGHSIMQQLTKGQTTAVQLHQELSRMQNKLNTYPELEPILKTIKGEWVNFTHRPRDLSLERVYALPTALRESLMNMVESAKEEVESCGDRFGQMAGPRSLWQAYIESDTVEEDDEEEATEEQEPTSYSSVADTAAAGPTGTADTNTDINQLMPGQWQCNMCTFINDREAARCGMCAAAKPAQLDDGEWEDTRSSRKGRRARTKNRGQQSRRPGETGGAAHAVEAPGLQFAGGENSLETQYNSPTKPVRAQGQSVPVESPQKTTKAAANKTTSIPSNAVWGKSAGAESVPSVAPPSKTVPPSNTKNIDGTPAPRGPKNTTTANMSPKKQQNPTMADIIAGDQRRNSPNSNARPQEFPALGRQRKESKGPINAEENMTEGGAAWEASLQTGTYDNRNEQIMQATHGYVEWGQGEDQQSMTQSSLMGPPEGFFSQPQMQQNMPSPVDVPNSLLGTEADEHFLGVQSSTSMGGVSETPLDARDAHFDNQTSSAQVNPLVSDMAPRQGKQMESQSGDMNGAMSMHPFSFPGNDLGSLGFAFGSNEDSKNDNDLMGDVGGFALPSLMGSEIGGDLQNPNQLHGEQQHNTHTSEGQFPLSAPMQNQTEGDIASIAPLGNLSTWSCFGENNNNDSNPLSQWDAFNGLQ